MAHGSDLVRASFGVGRFVTPAQAAMQTIVQSVTTDAVRGRAIGALQASMFTTSIVSVALAGIFANIIGIREVFLVAGDRKSTRLNSSHIQKSRMPSSA